MTRQSLTGTMPAKADADPQDGFSNDSPASGKPNRAANKSNVRIKGRQATPSPATEKVSGAGPAIAEHSKDAKAPKRGRQAGAYIKE